MPFIAQDRRSIIDSSGLAALPGIQLEDTSYVYYRDMVAKWNSNPGWDTAHQIYYETFCFQNFSYASSGDMYIAACLAWQTFYTKVVWPFLQQQIAENGDIT